MGPPLCAAVLGEWSVALGVCRESAHLRGEGGEREREKEGRGEKGGELVRACKHSRDAHTQCTQCHDVSLGIDEGGGSGLLRVEYYSTLYLWQLPPPHPCLLASRQWRDFVANQDQVPQVESGEGGGCGHQGQVGADAAGGGAGGLGGEEEEEREAGAKRLCHLLGSCAKRTRIREQALVLQCVFDCGARGLVRASDVDSDTLPFLCAQHACARCGGDVQVAPDGIVVCRRCAPAPEEAVGELFRARWAPALIVLSCPGLSCHGRVTLSATADDAGIQSLFAGIQVRLPLGLCLYVCLFVFVCLSPAHLLALLPTRQNRPFSLADSLFPSLPLSRRDSKELTVGVGLFSGAAPEERAGPAEGTATREPLAVTACA